jgi:hypothetical protein
MKPSQARLIVENLPEKRFAEALFPRDDLQIDDGMTTSGAIALAVFSLLEHPERPVALLLNAGTEEDRAIDELRGTVKRILARAAPEGWYVAIAVPRLDAWAVTDPRIKRDFDSLLDGKATYIDKAVRIGKLVREEPFDPTELLRRSPDFKGLVEFLQRHQGAQTAAPATASAP